jgi:hypothetical protein
MFSLVNQGFLAEASSIFNLNSPNHSLSTFKKYLFNKFPISAKAIMRFSNSAVSVLVLMVIDYSFVV